MKFKYVNFDGSETISLIFTTGDCMPVSISPAHDAWKRFKEALLLEDPDDLSEDAARDLLIKHGKAAQWVGSITDSVKIGLYGVTIDGEPFEGPLADTLTKMATEGTEDDSVYLQALAKFLEKANSNPSVENSNVLYKWIMNEGLTITPDGDFIGYKGVRNHEIENPNNYKFPEGVPVRSSTYSGGGGGVVNGVEFPKFVPNFVGGLVQMPRDKVNSNGNVECSVGLHVGTFKYAKGVIHPDQVQLVKVNPANVVAVSKDYQFQKIRCCEYLVVRDNVNSTLDVRLYIDEEFAPVSTEELTTDEKGTIEQIIQRLREASK